MNDRIAQDIEATREDVADRLQHLEKWESVKEDGFLARMGMLRDYTFLAMFDIKVSGEFTKDTATTIAGKCALLRFRLHVLRAAMTAIITLEALDERYPGLRDE